MARGGRRGTKERRKAYSWWERRKKGEDTLYSWYSSVHVYTYKMHTPKEAENFPIKLQRVRARVHCGPANNKLNKVSAENVSPFDDQKVICWHKRALGKI